MRWLFAFLCQLLSACCFAWIGYLGYLSISTDPIGTNGSLLFTTFLVTVYGFWLSAISYAAAKYNYTA